MKSTISLFNFYLVIISLLNKCQLSVHWNIIL